MATRAVLTPGNVGPPTTTPAPLTVVNGDLVLQFLDAATTTAVFSTVAPQGYTGTSTVVLYCTMNTATSGNVRVTAAIEAVTPADALNINTTDSFDSDNALTQAVATAAGNLFTCVITCANADSIAAGDLVRVRIARVGGDGADTVTGTLYVRRVELRDGA